MKNTLYEKLIAYAQSDIYPFCMPGHKRRNSVAGPLLEGQSNPAFGSGVIDPYQLDITEVEGFDDLHRAKGILKDITDKAAVIYGGTADVFMSVNGSTACNLAAVNAVPDDGPVLIAANCHRSVFNGAKISKRSVIELAPQWISGLGIYGGIAPSDVANALRGYPDIRAVVITSPSYEGFVSDVETIAKIVHENGAYLIVDEAHGAHLPFCRKLPQSALYLGADIVIHSLHKTVGSLNQTALAFVNNQELTEAFHEKLLLFTTTSPSYLLMASIEQAIGLADENRDRFDDYCDRLFDLRQSLEDINPGTENSVFPKHDGMLHIIDKTIIGKYNIFDLDQAKIAFYAHGVSGETLYRKFYEDHRLQFEKYGDRYALAMTTVWDTPEGFSRLINAAKHINGELK